ncbi:hypothetical protein ELQ92_15020 [Labedella populi]|uniref:Lipoprotein n=1 Tax=Labedella populi TaxID=2498850 RepID=A0A3S4DSR7_9MICO|nr:hypothetical protein [Labedella populi]RWZ58332.1 hypothetical protein ELQ92_15020 [Labedella populi]
MRARLFWTGATAVALMTALAGCADEPLPPEELEAINLGANAEAGPVSVDNLLVVTRDAGEPARLIGVLLNESDASVDVTLSDADDSVSLSLDPGQQYALHENPQIFDTADEIPGATTEVTVAVDDDDTTMTVPVRDGTMAWLEPYLPADDAS